MILFLLGTLLTVFILKKETRKTLVVVALCAIVFNWQTILGVIYVFSCMTFGNDCL